MGRTKEYLFTTECMQPPKYYVQMDSTSMQEILIFGFIWKTLLVLDNAFTHNTINVKVKFKYEAAIWMIPSDLTWTLQPLDLSINKVFKANLRNKYVKLCIENNTFKFTRTLSSN